MRNVFAKMLIERFCNLKFFFTLGFSVSGVHFFVEDGVSFHWRSFSRTNLMFLKVSDNKSCYIDYLVPAVSAFFVH